MVAQYLPKCSRFCLSLVADAPPRAVAAGMAFGVAIGLLPKTNVLVAAWLLVLCVSRAHLLAALAAAMVFHGVGILLDPVWHAMGHFVLTLPALQMPLASLYQLPGVPWTEFNNTVVCGTCLMGLAQFYPTYRGAATFFERLQTAGS